MPHYSNIRKHPTGDQANIHSNTALIIRRAQSTVKVGQDESCERKRHLRPSKINWNAQLIHKFELSMSTVAVHLPPENPSSWSVVSRFHLVRCAAATRIGYLHCTESSAEYINSAKDEYSNSDRSEYI